MVNTRKLSRQVVPAGLGSRRLQARLADQERRIVELERTIAWLRQREEARSGAGCPAQIDGPVVRKGDPQKALELLSSWLAEEPSAEETRLFDELVKGLDEDRARAGSRTLFS